MKLNFKLITQDNRQQAEQLTLADNQKSFIETVAECLIEADNDSRWHPLAIYDNEVMIGFAMYGYFDEYLPEGRLWLDRFLIDVHYQGCGYGKVVLQKIINQLMEIYPKNDIYLSVIASNQIAIHLYKSFGFHFINEKDIHGEDVMVKAYNKNKG